MDLYYGVRDVATIERADDGWLEAGAPLVLRVQPRAVAHSGDVRRETAFGRLFLVARHDASCRVALTPVLDGVDRDDLTETFDLAAQPTVIDEVVRLDLSETVNNFSRHALRGVFVTIRAELTPLTDAGDAEPLGETYGLGSISVEGRPVGVAGSSIPRTS